MQDNFSFEEKQRYSRHIQLDEFDWEKQLKLRNATIAVVGAGGLGCAVLQYLVAAGVGKIRLIDDDVVDLSNLQRQVLYNSNDLNQKKVLVAKSRLEPLNPNVKIEAIDQRLDDQNIQSLLIDVSLVIDCSDNFNTRYCINDYCYHSKLALVYGSIFQFSGQVAVFNADENLINYRDLFPQQNELSDIPSCNEAGVMGPIVGIVGNYQANEAIKLLGELGDSLSSKLLQIDISTNQIQKIEIPVNPNNPLRNPAIRLTKFTKAIHSISVSELMENLSSYHLVDVREAWELSDPILPSTNIALKDIERDYRQLPEGKNLAFICQSGRRSEAAVRKIEKYFDPNMLFNVLGGYDALLAQDFDQSQFVFNE